MATKIVNKHLKSFVFVLLIILSKGNVVAQEDTTIVYSAQKCAERIHYYYHQCTFCYKQPHKPIYWGKLISLGSDKNKWEFMFVQTEQGESTVCNFHIDAFFDNEDYLLLIDNCNLLSFSEKVFNTTVDSSIFFVDECTTVSNRLLINPFDPIMIWCKVSYCEQEFFVNAEWRKPYFDFPDQLRVFEFKLPSYDTLLDKYWFEEHYDGEINEPMVRHYDCGIFSTRLLQIFNGCFPIPFQLFRDNGVMTISNPFSLSPKRVSFVEKYQFR
jgi:hypothetical protein